VTSTVQSKMTALIPAVLANSLVFSMLAYVAFLHAFYPDLYYLNVQEDEFMEWATFWSFFLGSSTPMAEYRSFVLPVLILLQDFCQFIQVSRHVL